MLEGSRGDVVEVIVEALSNSSEITLLTVPQHFCAPITVKNGDYQKAGNPPEYPTYEARHGRKSNRSFMGRTFESNFSWLMMVFISRNYRLDRMIPEW
jgi:hypothetical protein